MDALRQWMGSDLDVIMVGTWMLCGNGWSLIWTLSWLAHGCSRRYLPQTTGRYHGWHMDALRQWMESDLDVIMVGTWMLCGNGWSLIWTLSWLAHGCSVRGKLKNTACPEVFGMSNARLLEIEPSRLQALALDVEPDGDPVVSAAGAHGTVQLPIGCADKGPQCHRIFNHACELFDMCGDQAEHPTNA
eukprot:s173_g12.t1